MSRIRQNFHEECEALINKQINMELYASYVYLSMVIICVNLKSHIRNFHLPFLKLVNFFRVITLLVTMLPCMDLPNISRKIPMKNVNMLKNSWNIRYE